MSQTVAGTTTVAGHGLLLVSSNTTQNASSSRPTSSPASRYGRQEHRLAQSLTEGQRQASDAATAPKSNATYMPSAWPIRQGAANRPAPPAQVGKRLPRRHGAMLTQGVTARG